MVEIKVKVCYTGYDINRRLFIPEPCCSIGLCYSHGIVYLPDYEITKNYCGVPMIKIRSEFYFLDDVIISRNNIPYFLNENNELLPIKFKVDDEIFYSE